MPVTVPAVPTLMPPVTPSTSTASATASAAAAASASGTNRSLFSGVTIQLPPPAWAMIPSASRMVVPAAGSAITKGIPDGMDVRLSSVNPSSASSSVSTAFMALGQLPAEGSQTALALSSAS